MSLSLEGRVAMVTGAGGGIGQAVSSLLAERGADVVVASLHPEKVEKTARIVREKGRKAYPLACDITETARFVAAVREAAAELGSIGILVNNAGISGNRLLIEEIDEAAFDRLFAINAKGAFFAAQAVVPGMRAQRYGKIINISSIYAMGGAPFMCHYAASKAALSGLAHSWARELAPHNIMVNAVAPGFVLTNATLAATTEEARERVKSNTPLGRFGEAEEMARAVGWLASAEADFVTGQVLSPNGGLAIVGY